MEAEYSKRVYQGVRVKHTVKDLLAEKRSRQTNGARYSGMSTTQAPFVQMAGSHMPPNYYGMRRSFLSDAELCPSSKQFFTEVYSSPLSGKSLSCDTTSVSTYSSLIDSCYPESFGDYRSGAFSSGGSAIFSPSALSSLLPAFPAESSHFMLRDSWEQPGPDTTAPVEGLCGDALGATVPVPTSLGSPEPGSPSQYRSSPRGPAMSAAPQPYSLHSLDDGPLHSSYQSAGSFPGPPYMTFSHDPVSKMHPLASEESENAPAALSESLPWGREEAGSAWSPYEIRRAF